VPASANSTKLAQKHVMHPLIGPIPLVDQIEMQHCTYPQHDIKIPMVRLMAKAKHTNPATQKTTGKGKEMERILRDTPAIVFALAFVEAVKEEGNNTKGKQPGWIASQRCVLEDPVTEPDHEDTEKQVNETFHKFCRDESRAC